MKKMGLTNPGPEILSRLSDSVKVASALPQCKNVFRKMHGNLARRIKLLSPLFEELRYSDKELSQEEIESFGLLRIALDSSVELLQSVNGGSKLYQVLFLAKLSVWFPRRLRKGKRNYVVVLEFFIISCFSVQLKL